jgi:cytochrome c oxidase subunit 2
MMKTLQSIFQKITLLLLFSLTINQIHAAGAPKGDAAKGEQVFQSYCTSCHKLGDVLIGPDLTGVISRWPDYAKLHDWVKNPSKYIDNGDPYVAKLMAKANGARMTVPPLTDAQIDDVLAYANTGGGKTTTSTTTGPNNTSAYAPVPEETGLLKWLFIGVLVLIAVILYLANRIWNTFKKNEKPEDDFTRDRGFKAVQKFNAWMMPIFGFGFLALCIWECTVHLTPTYQRPESASDIGVQIDKLFNQTVLVTAIVFFITQILLFYFTFRYSYKKGKKGYYYPHNNTIEFIWTIVPALVLSYLVLQGFKTWRAATDNPDNKPLTVEAFAKQFDWTFRYPGPDGKLGRTNFLKIDPANNPLGIDYSDPASKDDYITTELHLPVNRDIYLKLRSQDVIHDAYLPHFRMQMYAQPGMDNRLRFKPIITTVDMRKKVNKSDFNYELACNQLCGAAHYNMRRIITVETDNEFGTWEKTNKPAYDSYKASLQSASLK